MAKNREGGEQNLALLDRALKLRYELAQLHGMPDYATYAIKRRMAQTPAAVNEFLGKVQAAVDEVEARELAELRADKAKFTGTDPAVPDVVSLGCARFIRSACVARVSRSIRKRCVPTFQPTRACNTRSSWPSACTE